jgi:hypothetical protein
MMVRTWKEVFVAYFELLFQYLPAGTEEDHEYPLPRQLVIDCNLPNTNLK